MVIADSFFRNANYIEAGLWGLIAIGFLVNAILRTKARATALIAAFTFVAFGISDVVEANTGAWWRPSWLLAWKGVCVAVFLALLCRYVLSRNTALPSSATSSDRPARA